MNPEYPDPDGDVEKDLRVKHESYNHPLQGNAFNYLTRFWLEANCGEVYKSILLNPDNPPTDDIRVHSTLPDEFGLIFRRLLNIIFEEHFERFEKLSCRPVRK